ncbi:MAG: radical SAM protein [Myxococcota bacterium]
MRRPSPGDELRARVAAERGPAARAPVPRGPAVALAYPSPYRAAMSSLGYQWIATILREAGFGVERVMLPDDVDVYRNARAAPRSYETHTPLGAFPVIAVSFAYETELVGLFDLLDLAGIPVRRADRGPDHPKILVGGPISMASPTFLAPFADALLLGEAEDTIVPAIEAAHGPREVWLDAIEALPGGWVPERGGPVPPMAKASDARLPARSAWLCPDAELSDMFLIEGERGCHRMCTFCVLRRTTNGGMRLVDRHKILSLIPEEAHKVGLVGAAISDHPDLVGLLEVLVGDGRQVSVSSLRADRLAKKPAIAELLRRSGARTLTTASDGASERLRRELKKGTTREHLEQCAEQAARLGYDTLKLYMMLGVPGETDEDVDQLIAESVALAAAARPARLALGVAPFVAKAQTPLDRQPFAGIGVVEDRFARLRKGVGRAVEIRPASARWAWIEHQLAQGGPAAGLAMWEGWRAGGTFGHYRRALRALEDHPHQRRGDGDALAEPDRTAGSPPAAVEADPDVVSADGG